MNLPKRQKGGWNSQLCCLEAKSICHVFEVKLPACSSLFLCECISRVAFHPLSCSACEPPNPIISCVSLLSPCLSVSRRPQRKDLKLTSHWAAATRPQIPRAAVIRPDRKRGTKRGREREGLMATLTKDCTTLRGQNMYSLFICAHYNRQWIENESLCVCVRLDANKAYDGAFRAAFSLLLGERTRGRRSGVFSFCIFCNKSGVYI